MNYKTSSGLRAQPSEEPLVLLHVPTAVSHAFGPALGGDIITKREQPFAEESVHASEMRDLVLGFPHEIDLKLTLKLPAVFLVNQ